MEHFGMKLEFVANYSSIQVVHITCHWMSDMQNVSELTVICTGYNTAQYKYSCKGIYIEQNQGNQIAV